MVLVILCNLLSPCVEKLNDTMHFSSGTMEFLVIQKLVLNSLRPKRHSGISEVHDTIDTWIPLHGMPNS